MALGSQLLLVQLELIAAQQWQTLFLANMSTSHYSRPYRPAPAPNTPKRTGIKLAIIGGLLLVDILACIGASNLGEAATFAGLAIINLWALNWSQ